MLINIVLNESEVYCLRNILISFGKSCLTKNEKFIKFESLYKSHMEINIILKVLQQIVDDDLVKSNDNNILIALGPSSQDSSNGGWLE